VTLKTRTTNKFYDATLYGNSISDPTFTGSFNYSVSSQDIVELDYPEWDWKHIIATGGCATTSLHGSSEGFTSFDPSRLIGNKGGPVFGYDLHDPFRYHFKSFFGSLTRTDTTVYGFPTAIDIKNYLYEDSSLYPYVENQALMSFNSKTIAAMQDFSGLVAAGELGESLRMILRPAQAIRNSLSSYLETVKRRSRRYVRNSRGLQDMISGTWLEYSFGWKPLIHDIHDGAKALANALYYKQDRTFVAGRAFGLSKSKVITTSVIDANNVIFTRRNVLRAHLYRVKFYGSLRHTADLSNDLSRFGISWGSFIPSAWELIPYSFLVDYFTNIGEILQSFQVMAADLAWITRGTESIQLCWFEACDVTYQDFGATHQQTISAHPGGPVAYGKRVVDRSLYTGSRIPSLSFEVPGLGVRWINIAALTHQHRDAVSAISKIL
jgi:hypothetical protein